MERCIHSFYEEIEGKITLVDLRRRWEDNIKMELQEVKRGH